MKVIEKGTDRRALVNIYVVGQVPALKEYGEYIDPTDKAICCYVPLDEGHKPRIGGRFSGTTLAVAHDTIVDGVLRKASSYAAKAVSYQQSKKIDAEKFLFKTKEGIIDTDITVAPLLDVITTQGDAPETIGTIELRLYITRQLGVSHDIGNTKKYYAIGGNVEDEQADDTEMKASYKLIPPTFRMSFEKNSAPLEDKQPNLQQRRADAKRPGTEPWAIFRFHYRSQEEILERNIVMTYDPTSKEMTEPRTLILDPVPPLQLGAKQLKNDGDASSRSSSPMPPGTPSATAKSAQSAPKIPSPTKKKPGPKSKSTDTTKMTSTTEQAHTATPKASSLAPPESATSLEIQDKFSAPLKTPTAEDKKALTNGKTDSGVSTATTNSGGDKIVDKIADAPSEPTADSTAKVSSVPDPNSKPASVHPEKSAIATKETVTKPQQSPITPAKKPIAKPAPISTTTTSVQKKSDIPPVAAVPAKRNTPTTNGATPEPKRTKVTPTPFSLPVQPAVPRTLPRSPTPKTMSIERQLADQRKKLEEMRKKRMETAQKQAAIDEQMGPYKQRMAEELERLNREMMEEESAYTEEAERYSASVEILQEFKKADGGK